MADLTTAADKDQHTDDLTFRDFSQLADDADSSTKSAAGTRDSSEDSPAEGESYDVNALGKWFAAYLPAKHRKEIRNNVQTAIGPEISIEHPVTRETVLSTLCSVTLEVQAQTESVDASKAPISENVLQASMRSLSVDGTTSIKYTSRSEIETVISEFFLDIADRLRGRTELADALLSHA
ncbi:hypothetical protein [Salinibaculum rarum]|uniref:hypothetical protein n=1 Tax=Salinibaculum rarum TaxID=3058903 RepID=UPI00265DB0AE|nr:hypothetical protein [Salinibaculum sp. KK48]